MEDQWQEYQLIKEDHKIKDIITSFRSMTVLCGILLEFGLNVGNTSHNIVMDMDNVVIAF